jgi:hypothetical protein
MGCNGYYSIEQYLITKLKIFGSSILIVITNVAATSEDTENKTLVKGFPSAS